MDFFFLRSFWGLWYLTFLSGFVILRISRYRSSLMYEMTGSLGMSLLINYTLVFFGTFFHIPLGVLLWSTSFLFLGIFFWILSKETPEERKQSLWTIYVSLGMLLFLWFLNQFVAKSGSIPWAGDDILGWNSWAMLWYQEKGIFVQQNFYPQMLPIMWAASYFFSGTSEIFFFSRSLMPYFFFGIFIMGLAIFWMERRITTLFGLLSLGWLFVLWRHFPRMTMGIADIPAAFFAFASFGFFLEYQKTKKVSPFFISLLLAVASSLTKQYGVLYLAGWGLLCIIEILKCPSLLKHKGFWIITAFALLLFTMWYGYGFFAQGYHRSFSKLFTVGSFQAYSSNPLVSQESTSLTKNLKNGLLFLSQQFKYPVVFFFMVLLWITGMFVPPFGWVALFITIPAFVFWSELIAYDIRNFSIGIVFFLYQAGIGIGWVTKKIISFLPATNQKKSFFSSFDKTLAFSHRFLVPSGLVVFMLIVGCSLFFSHKYLSQEQNRRMKKYVGNHREVNAMLYEYLEKKPSAVVYTDYSFAPFMPDMHYLLGSFTNLAEIQKAIANHHDLVFLIISSNGFPPSRFSPEVETFFRTNSRLKKVMDVGTGMLVEKK